MTNNPLVSIVVPVCNAEKYLSQCIESLLNQTYNNIEIICVNDGSDDGSQSMLIKYAVQDMRLKLINISNAGVSNARNVGLSHVSGSLVMFVDAYDWIDGNCIEVLVNFMDMHGCDIVMFPYVSERPHASLKRELFDGEKVFVGDECNRLARLIIGPIDDQITSPTRLDSYGTIWGKLYDKKNLKDVEFVDLSLIGTAEDSLYNMFVFKRAQVIGYCPDILYHYRRNINFSLTRTWIPQFKEKRKYMYHIISDSFISEDEKKALTSRIAIDTLGLLINAYDSPSPNQEIKELLNDEFYHKSLLMLNISRFPIHWKLFYYVAKNRYIMMSKLLLGVIKYIRYRLL